MNDDEARALGERWIKAGGGWRPGMVDMYGVICLWVHDEGHIRQGAEARYDGNSHEGSTDQIVPDLRDPATRGVVLDVVRERHGRPSAYVAPVRGFGHQDAVVLSGPRKGRKVGPDGWAVYGLGLDVLVVGANEAEALVSALEIAP